MAAPVSLLLNPPSASLQLKPSKPSLSIDDPSQNFKSTLSRATDRQSKESAPADDSSKPSDETDAADDAASTTAKKSDSDNSTKKTTAKSKPRKPAAKSTDQADDESGDETAVKAKKPAAAPSETDAEADAAAAEATAAEDVPGKAAETKDKPAAVVDPLTVAQLAVQPAPKAQTSEKPAEDSAADAAVAKTAAPADAKLVQTTTAPADAATAEAAQAAADGSTVDPAAAATAKAVATDKPTVAPLGEEDVAVQPSKSNAVKKAAAAVTAAANTVADDAQAIAQWLTDQFGPSDAKGHDTKSTENKDAIAITPDASALATKSAITNNATGAAKTAAPPTPPETQFAETNHPDIVKNIQTQLMPHGGTMQLRLDPPELGALQVTLTMKDGVMNATFQASNEDATRLLSHSMSQLKTAMENAGVTVDKLQVQHTPRDSQANSNNSEDQGRGQPGKDDMSRQQEQQRKDMIKRMWRKLAGENDPLDMVA